MATLITNNTAGNILIQTGTGVPNHVAPKGSQFTDITTANLYINKDGITNWILNVDASNSGATSNIYSFNSFSSTTIGQTFVSTNIINDTITFSGIGLNIITDDTNNILTFSSSTDTDTYITGGTYNPTNGIISFTNNLGGGFNVSGLFKPSDDKYVTGATYNNNNTFTFTNNSGNTFDVSFNTFSGLTINGNLSSNTISATTYYNLPVTNDTFVTGGTYSNGTATFTNNTGGTFNVNGFYTGATDVYVTGLTFNPSNYDLTISRNDNVSFTESLAILSSDMVVTGGTYNSSTGIATFTNNSGGTFNVNGFLTGMTDTYVTGLTYSNNLITLKQNSGQPNLSILIDSMSGLTINGALSATTISATTYYNLPTDIRVTGGTYSNGTTTFTNNTGGTFNVTGYYTGTTDVYTTGATYNNNTFTHINNTGGTYNVSFNSVTGLTVNGTLSATTISGDTIYANNFPQLPYIDNQTIDYYVASGDTFIRLKDTISAPSGGTRTFIGNVVVGSGFSANTISATTYYNLPTDIRVTGGTYSNGTIVFTNNTGGTFNVTGLSTGNTDTFVTGGTYNSSNNTFTYTNNTGGTFNVSFNQVTGLTATTLSVDYIDFNTATTSTLQVGRLQWNDADEIGGLEVMMKGGNVSYQLGEENLARVYNADSVPLTAGTIVYVYGSQGNTISVKRGSASGETTSAKVLGVVDELIPVGGRGFVNTFGLVRDLNTASYSGGSALWLGVEAGTFTNVKPNAPYHNVLIGFVSRVHATTGSIFIHISNGWELDELHDVISTGATFGDILSYSGYNGYNVWKSTKTLNGSYTITGNTTIGGTMQAATVSATTYQNLPTDIRVTGATYNNNTFTYTNNTGGTFNVLFNSVTGLTVDGTLSATTISGATIYANDFPQLPYTDNQTLEIYTSGGYDYLRLKDTISAPSGGTRTFNGNVAISSGLTSTTISATTYQNLPTDIRITGGTYSSGTATFTNNTGGTFNVTGFYTSSGGTDTYTTGATYNNNTFTYTNNTGGTFNVSFNNVTGLTVNGVLSATTYYNLPDAELDTKIFGYRVNSATQKAYKTTQTIVGNTMSTGTINGESIYCQKFYAQPNESINEIVFRIMTAGASGLGLAQARILIYRSKLNANNEIIGGDLELDTNVNISTLSTGLKVVTGLNHTLSNNTYKNVWFMCIRNYQSGSLSLKFYTTTDIVSKLYDISSSSTTAERDLGWYFSCLYTSATPASMPVSASTSPSTTAVASTSGLVAIGYSNY